LPLALIVGGRYSPYLISLPLVAMPICGKTLRELSYYHDELSKAYGWTFLFAVPMSIMLIAAMILVRRGLRGDSGRSFARWSLLIASWLYFTLNFVFFRMPWPWEAATARTPSAIVFAGCLLLITLACAGYRNFRRRT
jgi:hypothetical protein